MILPQPVSSDVCLSCRGCCVFGEPASFWRARLTIEEEISLERRLTGQSFGGQLLTEPSTGGRHRCRCLNEDDHRCRDYARRPFECALYPFLLSSEAGRLRLYAHLACPFVREKRNSPEWGEIVAGIKRFFLAADNAGALKAMAAAYPDYSSSRDELEDVADVSGENGADVIVRHRAQLDGWFARRRPVLSACSLAGVFAWCDLFDFSLDEVDGNGLVRARQRGADFLYCPPLGAMISPRAVEAAFSRMQGGAARIEAVAGDELVFFDSTRYRAHEQGAEYYYERARIASLAGNGYRSKRSDINGFLGRHRPVFRPFCPGDAAACHDLFDRWLDKRRASYEDDIYRAMLVENRPVHRRLLSHASWLGLVGRVVEVDGVIAGYTFGYPLNSETFCVALEVTAAEYKGLSSFIFREFCADAGLASFKYINAMDDFGMPGVARAKRSWRPAFMEKVYSVCLKP